MSKSNPVGYDNVPARAESFARYILAQHGDVMVNDLEDIGFGEELMAKIVSAFFAHHAEWQRARNVAGGEAEQEQKARNAQKALEAGKKLLANEAKLREQLAAIEAAKKEAAKAS